MQFFIARAASSRYAALMGDGIQQNLNVLQTAGGHVAAIGLTRIGRGPLGAIITPATWIYNYESQGSTPSSVDVGYWGVSLAGGILGPVSLAASYIKALIDDDVQRKVLEVRKAEAPSPYCKGILALTGWGPPSSLAAKFAIAGGTAWQHHNGVWVGVVDGSGKLIPNFRPRSYRAIMHPIWPLQSAAAGGGYVVTDKFLR
jgi:hypothetical protein